VIIRGLVARVVRERTLRSGRPGARQPVLMTKAAVCVPRAWENQEWASLTRAQRLHVVLQDPSSGWCGRLVSYLILITTIGATLALMLQTVPDLEDSTVLVIIDVAAFFIFATEYILRFAVCDAFYQQTRWEFFTSPSNINDLISVTPAMLLDMAQGLQPIRVLRAVRILRVFRIFSLTKYSEGMSLMLDSLVGSTRSLSILGLLLGIGVMLFSSLLFHAERMSCPDVWSMSETRFAAYRADCKEMDNGWSSDGYLCCDERGYPDDFFSIAVTFWWCLVTMTTVGYGDLVPKSFLGRTVAIIAMIIGIVLISLPVAIVGSRFQQNYMDLELERSRKALGQHRHSRGSGHFPDALDDESKPSKESKASDTSLANLEASADSPHAAPAVKEAWSANSASSDSRGNAGGEASSSRPAQVLARSSSQDHSGGLLSGAGCDTMPQMMSRLDTLELSSRLPMEARAHLAVLQELLDHLDRVNRRLNELKNKDRDLDRRIHQRVMCITREFSAHILSTSSTSGAPS